MVSNLSQELFEGSITPSVGGVLALDDFVDVLMGPRCNWSSIGWDESWSPGSSDGTHVVFMRAKNCSALIVSVR